MRPLAWLDVQTLEETKIPGTEKAGVTHLFSKLVDLNKHFYMKLTENRILIMNDCLVFIYDLKLDKVIAEQEFTITSNLRFCQRFMKVDNFFVKSGKKCFHMMKTKKTKEGEEVVEQQKLIHFNDLTPTFSQRGYLDGGFNFFKLENGNYQYLAIRSFGRKSSRQIVTVEICPETLRVIKFRFFLPDSIIYTNKLQISDICSFRDLIVFKGRLRRPDDEEETYETRFKRRNASLVLATDDFTKLDHCPQSKLDEYFGLTPVSTNRIISVGPDNRIYLHEINFEERKLILLKSVILDGLDKELDHNDFKSPTPSNLCFMFRDGSYEDEESIFLLKFDQNLQLTSHLTIRGFTKLGSVYGLGGNRVAFTGVADFVQGLYVIDLETREVHIVHQYDFQSTDPNYVIEDQGEDDRRILSLELMDEKIVKVVLN